jgi:hypothetical protein
MRTILLLGAVSFSLCSYAQQEGIQTTQPTIDPNQKTPTVQYKGATHTEVRRNSTVTISKRPGQPQRTHDTAYYNEEIAKIDAHIASIDTKITHVNANPTEQAAAQQDGWFQQMEQIKSDLNAKKTVLIQKRDNL